MSFGRYGGGTCEHWSASEASGGRFSNYDVCMQSVRMEVEAVLFDYGLVLTGPPDPASWEEMKRVTRLEEAKFSAAYWAPRLSYDKGLLTGREYWLAVGRHGGVTLHANVVDALIAADNRLWTQINQPMADWAMRLQAARTRTGVLSNLGDEMMHGVLAAFPWLHRFDHHTWSHTLKMAKPQREIYAHAAAGMGVVAGAILFVDDRADNVQGALDAGMQAICYTTQGEFEQDLMKRGHADLWLTGSSSPRPTAR